MELKSLEVPKKFNNYADAIAATGLAKILMESLEGLKITVEEAGDHYKLNFEHPIKDTELENFSLKPGFEYFKTKGDKTRLPHGGTYFDYDREREIEDKAKEGKKPRGISSDEEGSESLTKPNPKLSLWKLYYQMVTRKGSKFPNNLYLDIMDNKDTYKKMVFNRLGLLAVPDKEKDEFVKNFRKNFAPLQLFNPSIGKGYSLPKPLSTSRGSFEESELDWLFEWAKPAGFLCSAFPGIVKDGQKVFVLVPKKCTITNLILLQEKLLKERTYYGKLKAEISAMLTLVEQLIEHSEEYAAPEPDTLFTFGGKTPNDIILGFYSTYFKSLGMSSATMDQSFLATPGWFPIKNKEDASDWINIIGEHRSIINTLDEDNSDDILVLQHYRNFIGSGKNKLSILFDFLEFSAQHATIILGKINNEKPYKLQTTKNQRRLLMSFDVSEIINNEGFKALANAVRNATVNAQIALSKNRSDYQVHYGLAQEWKRKARHPKEFTESLSEFAALYNYETARYREQNPDKPHRPFIQTEELNQFFELMKKHDPTLVALLLLAYGFALESKEGKTQS